MDSTQREKWISELMKDHPRCDRLMCEMAVDLYLKDPDYINGIVEGTIPIEEKKDRNEEYNYKGITIE